MLLEVCLLLPKGCQPRGRVGLPLPPELLLAVGAAGSGGCAQCVDVPPCIPCALFCSGKFCLRSPGLLQQLWASVSPGPAYLKSIEAAREGNL